MDREICPNTEGTVAGVKSRPDRHRVVSPRSQDFFGDNHPPRKLSSVNQVPN
jgi:hypothetical protein